MGFLLCTVIASPLNQKRGGISSSLVGKYEERFVAAEAGLPFTYEEGKAYALEGAELNDAKLDSVAGGTSARYVVGGGSEQELCRSGYRSEQKGTMVDEGLIAAPLASHVPLACLEGSEGAQPTSSGVRGRTESKPGRCS